MRGALTATVRPKHDAEPWALERVMSAAAPAAIVRDDGSVVAANALACVFMVRGGLATPLQALAADTCGNTKTQICRVALHEGELANARRLDVTLVPLPGNQALVIGRDVTLETSLAGALAASRDLFRDLALCFTDFAFETDGAGVFSWASPNGVLGYSGDELHGTRPAAVFGGSWADLFSSRAPINGGEIWVRSKSGGEGCLAMTAFPVVDAQGEWRGVRGVARDVTALKLAERERAQIKRRDELIDAIVDAVRAQVEPRRMMLAAADALAAATASDAVTIRASASELFATVGVAIDGAVFEIESVTSYQSQQNGCVRLVRAVAGGAYGAAEKALLDAVVPHLGVAIALAQSIGSGSQSFQKVMSC